LHDVTSLGPIGPGRPAMQPAATVREHRRTSWRPASCRSFSAQVSATDIVAIVDASYGTFLARPTPSAGAYYALRFLCFNATNRPEKGHPDLQFSKPPSESWLSEVTFGQLAGWETTLVMAVEPSRLDGRYGARGFRYALLEAGHAAQEAIRASVELGLSCCPIGAFCDGAVRSAIDHCSSDGLPLYLLALGRPK